jgi:hypothetical protein
VLEKLIEAITNYLEVETVGNYRGIKTKLMVSKQWSRRRFECKMRSASGFKL